MAGQRKFSTAAVGAMLDKELTGLDWRVYLWVSLHDGMSLNRPKGKPQGQGCIASNKTLFEEVGCDYTAGCRSISKLVERGHIVREKTGRMTRYRVLFPDVDNLRVGNTSTEDAPLRAAEITCEPASENSGIACREIFESRGKLPKTDEHYILRSSRIDFAEAGIKNSVETAQRAFSAPRGDGFSSSDDCPSRDQQRRLDAQHSRPSLRSQIGMTAERFGGLEPDVQIAVFERAFGEVGRSASRLTSEEQERWADWLASMYGQYTGSALGYRVERLLCEWESTRVLMAAADLRDWTRAAIANSEYGEQGRIAKAAGIPASVLSQFKNGHNLPDRFCEPLRHALEEVLPFHRWRQAA